MDFPGNADPIKSGNRVRFGSKADVAMMRRDACFTPESGHCLPV
jgi:hypothetical protein